MAKMPRNELVLRNIISNYLERNYQKENFSKMPFDLENKICDAIDSGRIDSRLDMPKKTTLEILNEIRASYQIE